MNYFYLKYRFFTISILLFLYQSTSFAQNVDLADSLIKIHGNVYDIQSKEPIKAIVTYQMIPYENNVGIAMANEDGAFQLYMIKKKHYTLEVSAKGYLSLSDQITIRDINEDGKIEKNFELMPITIGRVMKLNKLFFVQSKADITEDSYPQLNILVRMLEDYPSMVIQLEGHTDYRGSASLNMELSEDRVDAIKDYLTSKGIKKRRIKTQAFGGTKPITTEASEEAQSRNRRVEVRILKN